jgi:hypothetical protein
MKASDRPIETRIRVGDFVFGAYATGVIGFCFFITSKVVYNSGEKRYYTGGIEVVDGEIQFHRLCFVNDNSSQAWEVMDL